MKYSTEVPKLEGWYWCRYEGKHGTRVCPCEVMWFSEKAFFVMTAKCDIYCSNNIKAFGKMEFGDLIPFPE